ncbi:hypothetical protein GH733_010910 [Mirounga leonina]|nr:hypothetical protein GH733_010910 [Mirounga leonina]
MALLPRPALVLVLLLFLPTALRCQEQVQTTDWWATLKTIRNGIHKIDTYLNAALDLLGGEDGLCPCCNQQDRCYETCGKSKNDCDEEFQYCLSKICRNVQKTRGLAQRVQACETTVELLFDSVIHLGCKPYLDSQGDACRCRYEEKGHSTSVVRHILGEAPEEDKMLSGHRQPMKPDQSMGTLGLETTQESAASTFTSAPQEPGETLEGGPTSKVEKDSEKLQDGASCSTLPGDGKMSRDSSNKFILLGKFDSGRTLNNIQKTARDIFDILTGEKDMDNPLCEDCTDKLLEQVDT